MILLLPLSWVQNVVDMVVSGSFNRNLPIYQTVGEGFVGLCGVISAAMATAHELSRCKTIEVKHKQVVMQLRGLEIPNACLAEAERRTNPNSSFSDMEDETKDTGAEPVGMSA